MKSLLVSLIFCVNFAIAAKAQCEKPIRFVSAKTEYLDSNKVVQRTVEENSTMLVNQKELTIIPGNPDNRLTGQISSNKCDWKIPFKLGKSIIRATARDQNGREFNVTIIIEGTKENVTAVLQVDERPNRIIRITATEFAEAS